MRGFFLCLSLGFTIFNTFKIFDMRVLKIVFLMSIILTSITNCASQKLEKVTPVAITEVYKQHWYSGVKSGGSGTNIFVVLSDQLPQNITLDSIYFEKTQLPLKQDNHNSLVFAGRKLKDAKNKYTLSKSKAITDDNTAKSIENKSKFQLKPNECIIRFTVSGTVKYFKYESLYTKSSPLIPKARPKQ